MPRKWGELLARAGIELVYLPRYSPEFNPIEQAWSKMKERLKAKAARSREALEAELKPALNTITAKDAEAGSGMPAMPYTDRKFALVQFVRLDSRPDGALFGMDMDRANAVLRLSHWCERGHKDRPLS